MVVHYVDLDKRTIQTPYPSFSRDNQSQGLSPPNLVSEFQTGANSLTAGLFPPLDSFILEGSCPIADTRIVGVKHT